MCLQLPASLLLLLGKHVATGYTRPHSPFGIWARKLQIVFVFHLTTFQTDPQFLGPLIRDRLTWLARTHPMQIKTAGSTRLAKSAAPRLTSTVLVSAPERSNNGSAGHFRLGFD